MIAIGELYFFNFIKDECNLVFDIGAQEDIHYIEIEPRIEYHLFEPNLTLYNGILKKLEKHPNTKVKVNPFGLGNWTGDLTYYPDSQSFFLRTVHMQSNPKLAITCSIKDFKEYIQENNINHIDFMKIDTEGGEPDILLPNSKFIKNNVDFIQFEYASTWLDRPDEPNIYEVYDMFKNTFDFYILFNSAHPISKYRVDMLTKIDRPMLFEIEQYMNNQYGFEIAMMRG